VGEVCNEKVLIGKSPKFLGTGGELAKHLIERFSLKDVTGRGN